MDVKQLVLQWDGDLTESIAVYAFIQQNFPAKINDKFFRFVYRSFYRLDGAGLTEELKDEYFRLLKDGETSLRKILTILHKYPTKRGYNTYQLSFATKLLHTLNNNLPIYDSNITYLFGLPSLKPKNLDQRIKVYNSLKEKFNSLLNDTEVQQRIERIKKKHSAEKMNNAKMLDFILWDIGKNAKKD